jgi:ribosome biogenesis GTPase
MTLEQLGLTPKLKEILSQDEYSGFTIGRVVVEHKERYVVQTEEQSLQAEITGNLRYSSTDSSDFPAVGDWVCLNVIDASLAIIVKILPRYSVFKRQAIGKATGQQIIATNLDVALIVQAMGHDFNLNRLERYLSICNGANIEPIIVINKIDLYSDEEKNEVEDQIKERLKQVKVLFISNETMDGFEGLYPLFDSNKTFGVLGSSGVGKSTLINRIFQKDLMDTKSVSTATNKGKHTTTHRELFVLEHGGVIIDTPGMRELGLTDDAESIALTFDEIHQLSMDCKFSDCSHTAEKGCAILNALDEGVLDVAQWENHQKLKREQEHYVSSVHEKRVKDKQFGKMVKTILNQKRSNR